MGGAAPVTAFYLFLQLSGWHLSIYNIFYAFCTSKIFHDKKIISEYETKGGHDKSKR